MTEIRVWAPRPRHVGLALAGSPTIPMQREARGWWRVDAEKARPGADYGFVLDGEGPFPDPRSAWQPAGVHGLSRLVDHDAFPWRIESFAPALLAEAILYELHLGTFTPGGTFDAAIPRLDALAELGVTHVELLPVAEFPGDRGWGYDGVDLFAPHHAYGGPDGLKRFVDACHARGLAVLLDVVYNHVGPDGNYLSRFGPYFTDRYRTPWGEAMNFDGPGSDEVRAFVVENAVGWIRDHRIDGLRLDAVHEIHDRSAVHILEAIASAVRAAAKALGREAVVIAESDLNDPRLVRPVARGGYGLDAQWNDDYGHAVHAALVGEQDPLHAQYRPGEDLAESLRHVFVFRGRYSPYRERSHGRAVDADVPASRFVGFVQNHDQTGNRALGERLAHLVDGAVARVAAALVVLGPFVPLLFAGEEWAASTPFLYFTDHHDPALADAVRRGRLAEFRHLVPPGSDVPDPQDEATFRRSVLRWAERDEPAHAAMLDWHRRLIAFRRSRPEYRSIGRPAVRATPDPPSVAFTVGAVTVALALGRGPVSVEAPAGSSLALASEEGLRFESSRVSGRGPFAAVLVAAEAGLG